MGIERAIEKLAPLAIAFVFVGIAVAIGAVVLSELEEPAYDTLQENQTELGVDVTSEPVHTLSPIGEGLVNVDVFYVDEEIYVSESTEYEVLSEEDGEIQVLNDGAWEGDTDAEIRYEYEYNDLGQANDILNSALDALDTLGSFLTVLAVVAVASLIFVMLKVFGRTANNSSMV